MIEFRYKLLNTGKILDRAILRFGILEFTFQENHLYTKGNNIFLHGGNRYQNSYILVMPYPL